MQYFLTGCIAALVIVLLILAYKEITRKREIKTLQKSLKDILKNGSQEYVMNFTESKEIIDLIEVINELIDDKKQIHLEFKRTEEASKKMLSNISHDIKTPLTVILGYLEMMQLKEQHENQMLNKVENKAKQVMEMIQKFFTLAKLEAGDTEIELSGLDIGEKCREIIVDYYTLLTESDFQVEIEIPDESVLVYANEESLERMLSNLITNAVRYGADGKYLGIKLYQDEKNAYVDVIDKGKGIAPDMTDAVFDRLYTMDDSRNRKLGGSGLGLAIAKTLAKKMNGDLTLFSIPGEKTVFTVTLKRISF